MIKQKELADPTSCLNKARDDEPVFVLKATDPSAPKIVRYWAGDYQSRKLAEFPELSEREHRKYREALDLADQMEEWKRNNP